MKAKTICFIFDIGKNNKIHESKVAQFKALIADFKDFKLDDVISSHIRMKRKHPDNSPLYYIKAVRHDLLQKNHEAWKKETAFSIMQILGERA